MVNRKDELLSSNSKFQTHTRSSKSSEIIGKTLEPDTKLRDGSNALSETTKRYKRMDDDYQYPERILKSTNNSTSYILLSPTHPRNKLKTKHRYYKARIQQLVNISSNLITFDYDIIYQKFILLLETISTKYLNTYDDLLTAYIYNLEIIRGFIDFNNRPSRNNSVVLRFIVKNKNKNFHTKILSSVKFEILDEMLYIADKLDEKDRLKIQTLMKFLIVTISLENDFKNTYGKLESIFMLNLDDMRGLFYNRNFNKPMFEQEINQRLSLFNYQYASDLLTLETLDESHFKKEIDPQNGPVGEIFKHILMNELNVEAEQIKMEFMFKNMNYNDYLNEINENLKNVSIFWK